MPCGWKPSLGFVPQGRNRRPVLEARLPGWMHKRPNDPALAAQCLSIAKCWPSGPGPSQPASSLFPPPPSAGITRLSSLGASAMAFSTRRYQGWMSVTHEVAEGLQTLHHTQHAVTAWGRYREVSTLAHHLLSEPHDPH